MSRLSRTGYFPRAKAGFYEQNKAIPGCFRAYQDKVKDIGGLSTFHCQKRVCGNMEAKWNDPQKGTVLVRARERQFARLIGMNNQMLSRAGQTGYDFGHDKWREFHDQATDAPDYIFDKTRRNCWACIVAVGVTSDIEWDGDNQPGDSPR